MKNRNYTTTYPREKVDRHLFSTWILVYNIHDNEDDYNCIWMSNKEYALNIEDELDELKGSLP